MKSTSYVVWITSLLAAAAVGFNQNENSDTEKAGSIAQPDIPPDELESYEAIKRLHKEMDDDLSGSVDLSESIDFVNSEMEITNNKQQASRQKAFHRQDSQITVDELWDHWYKSVEHNWTTRQVVSWLSDAVQLPQYFDTFLKENIDGRQLPRLTSEHNGYFTNTLKIINPGHRKKLQFKALDVVLFGFSGARSSYLRDAILYALLACFVGGSWFAIRQRRMAKQHIDQLEEQMKMLKKVESEFKRLESSSKLSGGQDKGDAANEMTPEPVEMEKLRKQLLLTQQLLESRESVAAPLALQPLLMQTYLEEQKYIRLRRQIGLREMDEAKAMLEKLSKKKGSLFGTFAVAHGTNEEIDKKLLEMKSKMTQLTADTEDCQRRWAQIESLCGFGVMKPPNLVSQSTLPRGTSTGSTTSFQSIGSVMPLLDQVRANRSFVVNKGRDDKPPAGESSEYHHYHHATN